MSGNASILSRGYLTRMSAFVARLAPLLRPVLDRYHYDQMLASEASRPYDGQGAVYRNPFNLDAPCRTMLSKSYPLAILSAHIDIAPIVANYYSSLLFPEAKITGGPEVTPPLIVPAYGIDTWTALGLFEAESRDDLADQISPAPALEWMLQSSRDGWYISANVNEYYIPGTSRYKRRDFRHPILLIGCSHRACTFSAVTYTQHGEYAIIEVPYRALAKAVVSRATFDRTHIVGYTGGLKRLRRFRVAPDMAISINPTSIRLQITDYLEGKKPPTELANPVSGIFELSESADYLAGMVFGINTYDRFKHHVEVIARDRGKWDPRVTRTFWEHKKMLVTRIQALEHVGILKPEQGFAALANQLASWSCNLHLMFCSPGTGKQGSSDLALISERFDEMKALESSLLDRTCLALRRAL